MPKKKSPDLSLPSSWKDLVQKKSRRSASRSAIRKHWNQGLKIFSLLIVLGLVGLIAFVSEKNLNYNSGIIQFRGVASPVTNIVFTSNGVLNSEWFKNWFGPMRKRTLMELDIAELHDDLLKEPQITSAKISRIFPSTLSISIQEPQPMLVLRLRDKVKGYQDLLVGRDGMLYQGNGYSSSRLAMLPSLRISPNQLKKSPDNSGYEPLVGMLRVSPLLELARREYPDLYRDWRVVSYERPNDMDAGAHVLVQSGRIGKIRFSPNSYANQMKRLRYLLMEPKFRKSKKIRSIDLSHDRSVFAKI